MRARWIGARDRARETIPELSAVQFWDTSQFWDTKQAIPRRAGMHCTTEQQESSNRSAALMKRSPNGL